MSETPRENADGTNRPLLRAAFVSLLVLLTIAAIESYRDLSMARFQETELREQIESTRQQIEILGETVERIENDEATLEQLAREELGWVRAGDVVIVLPEDEPAAGAVGPGSSAAGPRDGAPIDRSAAGGS